MKVFITGASSNLGADLLKKLAEDPAVSVIWCAVHRRSVGFEHPKIRRIPVDLSADFSLDLIEGSIDLTLHLASLTHARSERDYWNVNVAGTSRLIEWINKKNCRKFVYMSSRCATDSCGAYGASKREAEKRISETHWEKLLIIRPSEVFGAGGTEGVDQFIELAKRWKMVPLLVGHGNIRFSPVHYEDLVSIVISKVKAMREGVETLEVCGPEILTGSQLAGRIARSFGAIPIPVHLTVLGALSKLTAFLGRPIISKDQISRLVGQKTSEASSTENELRPLRRFLQ